MKIKVVAYLEERGRPIAELNLNPYGGRYWIEEDWGKRFSTKDEVFNNILGELPRPLQLNRRIK